jgi:hypothetical protein
VRYGSPFGGLDPGLAQNFLGQFLAGSPDVPDGGDNFGFALAACDFDDDGFDDLAVGVPGQDGPVDSGAVQVYYGAASGLGSETVLFEQGTPGIPGDPEVGEYFGLGLACGDFDADGHADLAIGAPFENENGLFDVGAEVVLYGSQCGSNFDNGDSGYWSETVP